MCRFAFVRVRYSSLLRNAHCSCGVELAVIGYIIYGHMLGALGVRFLSLRVSQGRLLRMCGLVWRCFWSVGVWLGSGSWVVSVDLCILTYFAYVRVWGMGPTRHIVGVPFCAGCGCVARGVSFVGFVLILGSGRFVRHGSFVYCWGMWLLCLYAVDICCRASPCSRDSADGIWFPCLIFTIVSCSCAHSLEFSPYCFPASAILRMRLYANWCILICIDSVILRAISP